MLERQKHILAIAVEVTGGLVTAYMLQQPGTQPVVKIAGRSWKVLTLRQHLAKLSSSPQERNRSFWLQEVQGLLLPTLQA